MDEKKRYVVVDAGSGYELMMKVNKKMEEGYVPSGGMAAAAIDEADLLYQAMILPEDPPMEPGLADRRP